MLLGSKMMAMHYDREKRLQELSCTDPINPMFDLDAEIDVPTLVTSDDSPFVSGEFEVEDV